MKKLNLIFALIGLVGQVLGFVGIFIADSNAQLMASLWTFLLFGGVGAVAKIDKSIERFEKFMDKVSMPIALICTTFLIGRALLSFIFGI
jgi:hypothetical membrane protein